VKTLRGFVFALLLLLPASSLAIVLGSVRGVVHDSQHRPIAQAMATLQAKSEDFRLSSETNSEGLFEFSAVPVGQYDVTVEAAGFAPNKQALVVTSGSSPILHYKLDIAPVTASVTVSAAGSGVDAQSATRTTLISREDIARYAGADGTNSFRMVTEFLPGAAVVHDQLHVRGGHEVTFAIDGVPLPNTNIASNVGPQINPKDVDYLEAQSGAYAADYGDRTYGVFNVATRNGFERSRQGELVASYGQYRATDDQFSFGDHTQRAAYYISLNGHRSDYGLEPPTSANVHNRAAGGGGLASLIYNATANDQLRFNGGFRADYYQVPASEDREREQDGFSTLTWAHTFQPGLLLTVAPFYHFNRAAFEGGASDVPSAIDNRASSYEGGQVALSAITNRNDVRVGAYAFAQQDDTLFSVVANDESGDSLQQRSTPGGNLEAVFVQDQFRWTPWLTLNGGVRLTHFGGRISENAADPRAGVAINIPRLHWVVRGSYSRFYQAPPLDTLSGPLLEFATQQGVAFLPLHGERDEQHEIGLAIPLKGWVADFAYFRTGAHNYFDHDVIGNSNIFFPLTIQAARIRGFESTLKSPLLLERYHAHLAFSNQQAEGFGGVTGGLTSFAPPPVGGFYLDHDQRNTLTAGVDGSLPWRLYGSVDVNYGSGFLAADGPTHLPGYATVDFSLGRSFGENFSVRAEATNIADRRYQLDASNTFGGSHFADPRMVAVQLRYRFHY